MRYFLQRPHARVDPLSQLAAGPFVPNVVFDHPGNHLIRSHLETHSCYHKVSNKPAQPSQLCTWTLNVKYVYTAIIKAGWFLWLLTYIAADICSVSPSLQGSFYLPSESCLQRAHTWHRRLCRLLLVAHRGLHTYHSALRKQIPQLQQTPLASGDHMQSSERIIIYYYYLRSIVFIKKKRSFVPDVHNIHWFSATSAKTRKKLLDVLSVSNVSFFL